MSFPLPANESKRLETLHSLNILDTLNEKEFDDLTRLAAQICEVPVSVISLIDSDRQWFKSKVGLDLSETPRDVAFCTHTILGDELFVVPNVAEDQRFAENPLVTGDPNIRFYAGAPLITDDGNALGSICVIDKVPRELRPEQKESLQALARQTMKLLNLRQQAKDLAKVNEKLNREIAERINVEKVLRLRDQAIATVSEGILITEIHPTDNKIIYANAGFEQMTGYKFDEICGLNCRFLQGKDTNPATVAEMRNAVKEKKFCAVEILNYRKDGTSFWNALSISPVKDDSGKVTHFVGVQKDITARKESEQKLQASEKRYRFLAESVPQQVWTALPDGRINYGNYRTIEYFGQKTHTELFDMQWTKILHPEDIAQTAERWARALKTGAHYETEFRLRRSDGEYRWHLAQAKPMFDDSGAIIKWFGTNTDIHDRKMAEKAARETAEYRNLFQNANDAILILDLETEIIVNANDKACEMYGYEHQDLIGKSVKEMSQDIVKGENYLQELSVNKTRQLFETVQFRADGTPINLLISSSVVEYQSRQVVLSINRDITDQKKAQEALRESQQMLQLVMDTIPQAIFWKDRKLKYLGCNRYMANLMKLNEPTEIVGKNDYDFNNKKEEADSYLQYDRRVIKTGIPQYNIIETHTAPDGSVSWLDTNRVPLCDAQNNIIGMLGTFQDITQRKRAEKQLTHNALHDSLTDLPNRALFIEHLHHTIKIKKRRFAATYAVLFLDFDHFKVINDSLGHMEGDKLLIQIAQRLKLCLRSGDIVARLGGDEFTILLDDLEDIAEALQIAERILDNLNSPFNLGGREIFISASIGIAMNDAEYTKPEEILRDADIAMYRAKAGGRARLEIFNQTMREQANTRLQLESEMRRAVKDEEFSVFYQPIIDLQNDKIVGFESLARWIHPTRGIVSPDEFIPLAEETGLIVPLGEWILRESCRQLRIWQSENPANADLSISVNLSCKQFLQPDLVECVSDILRETGLKAKYLRLEITESHLMEDSAAAILIMENLRSLGIKISIDDFGTGYSSLSYIHRLPINYLKIDRSFVSRMQLGSENGEIVRTIILLAKNLNIKVVAEGIETNEQAEFLKKLNCDLGQGYLYSKPVEAEQAELLFENTFQASNKVTV